MNIVILCLMLVWASGVAGWADDDYGGGQTLVSPARVAKDPTTSALDSSKFGAYKSQAQSNINAAPQGNDQNNRIKALYPDCSFTTEGACSSSETKQPLFQPGADYNNYPRFKEPITDQYQAAPVPPPKPRPRPPVLKQEDPNKSSMHTYTSKELESRENFDSSLSDQN